MGSWIYSLALEAKQNLLRIHLESLFLNAAFTTSSPTTNLSLTSHSLPPVKSWMSAAYQTSRSTLVYGLHNGRPSHLIQSRWSVDFHVGSATPPVPLSSKQDNLSSPSLSSLLCLSFRSHGRTFMSKCSRTHTRKERDPTRGSGKSVCPPYRTRPAIIYDMLSSALDPLKRYNVLGPI